jgi:hypothetical protein
MLTPEVQICSDPESIRHVLAAVSPDVVKLNDRFDPAGTSPSLTAGDVIVGGGGGVTSWNVAVTDLFASIVSEQAPLPLQASLHVTPSPEPVG